MRVAPHLRNLRGERWADLVDGVLDTPDASTEQLAFCLLLIRLDGCLSCHTDCYRAMRGCTACAVTSVQRFRGNDAELLEMFETALEEVTAYMQLSANTSNVQVTYE
jgi:hypothetical protein